MSGAETIEMLANYKPGTFLVRFSTTQVGAYAVSFVGTDNQIIHSLIEHDGVANGSYKIVADGQPMLFGSLKEVVNFYGDALQYPIRNETNPLYVQAVAIILGWKQERGRRMEAVQRIVADLFDVRKDTTAMLASFPASKRDDKDPRVEAIITRIFTT